MAYNRKWLRDQVAAFMHDRNLGNQVDTFIDIAITKISQLLESQYNEKQVTRSLTASPYGVEADMVSIRNIHYQTSQGGYLLTSVPSHNIEKYATTGNPAVYAVNANSIVIKPFSAGDYDITYFGSMTLGTNDTDTFPALQNYPFLFLDAALAEGYDYKQDPDQRTRYQDKWITEAHEINRRSRTLRQGDVPAMRTL